MADVPLLKAFVSDGAETGHIGAGRLELREWRDQMVIIKIVVEAEVLLVIEAVVKPNRKLVGTLGLHGRTYKFVAAIGWSWDELQQVNRGRIQATKGNNVIWEEVRIKLGVWNVGSCPQCCRTVRPLIEWKRTI